VRSEVLAASAEVHFVWAALLLLFAPPLLWALTLGDTFVAVGALQLVDIESKNIPRALQALLGVDLGWKQREFVVDAPNQGTFPAVLALAHAPELAVAFHQVVFVLNIVELK